MKNRTKNIVGKIIIICLIIILLELSIMAVMKVLRERNIDRINNLNDIAKVEDGYIVVGESDFHNSKYVQEKNYEYTIQENNEKQSIITTQARIAKYDDKMNLVWENTYENDYDSTFYSVLAVSDGYVAVGSFVNEYSQIDANTRDAIIVKYDKNGKLEWENTYKVLSDTEFYKIIEDDDNYVVIGQSIYENLEMGTHITGGGIIVRYSSEGEELAHNNYGGNKSGIFNDIIKVNDGYIVCGKDAANYGIVVKFKKDFNREENDYNLISKKVLWQRTYSNTDTKGFTAMTLVNDKIYVVGALNISNEKDKDNNTIFKYDAGMVFYNTSGKYIGRFLMNDENHHRFNSVVSDDKYLYLSMQLDVDLDDTNKKQTSSLIKYSLLDNTDNKIVERHTFNEKNDYIINKLVKIDNQHMYVGTENNSCTLLGCDYNGLIGVYEDLKNEK